MNEIISKFVNKTGTINQKDYEEIYKRSINDNDTFWAKEGKRIEWIKPFSKIKEFKYSKKNVDIKWYYDGKLNVSYNCIDRHAINNPDKIAIIWEGDEPSQSKKISYKNLIGARRKVTVFFIEQKLFRVRVCTQILMCVREGNGKAKSSCKRRLLLIFDDV